MRITGPKAFEKLRAPMDRLCRVVIAIGTGEADAEEEYTSELERMGYAVAPSFDALARPMARQLVVPSGSTAVRNELQIIGGMDVRIIDALVEDMRPDTGRIAVRTYVMAPAKPEYRTAVFADGSARGRLLTLGTPSGGIGKISE
jgi:hypothetical protein